MVVPIIFHPQTKAIYIYLVCKRYTLPSRGDDVLPKNPLQETEKSVDHNQHVQCKLTPENWKEKKETHLGATPIFYWTRIVGSVYHSSRKKIGNWHAKYFQALGISCFQWGQYVSMFFLAGTNCRREWGKFYKWGKKCDSITLVPLDVAWASFFVRFQHEPNIPKISSVRIPAPQIPATLLSQPVNLYILI